MSDNTELKNKIESAWENITKISPNDTDIADAVNEVIKKLDNGQFRIAEKNGNDWIVNQWLKKAVLISFRINDNKILKGPYTSWYDKVKGLKEYFFSLLLRSLCLVGLYPKAYSYLNYKSKVVKTFY